VSLVVRRSYCTGLAIQLSCSECLVSVGGQLGTNAHSDSILHALTDVSSVCSHYRGEGAAMAGGPGVQGANRLTTSDALSYLREVKNRFSNNKHIYDTFLEIMKEFKAQR